MITTEDMISRPLTIDDLKLYVCVPRGTNFQEDTTCDSEFMLDLTRPIGKAIRDKFHWLPMATPISLFMDNAGGHGTEEAKTEYIRILKEDFNIIIEWQVPNSPELNLLDLGVWCAIQHVVEQLHRLRVMSCDSLAKSVVEAWEKINSEKLTNVAARWIKVLHLIIKGAGTNDLVETERGKKFNPLTPTEYTLDADENSAYNGDDGVLAEGQIQM